MTVDDLGFDTCCYMVQGAKFEVCKNHTVLEPVGQGAYGVVCAAQDEGTKQHIAIKKIENAFEHITFTKRTLRELRILRHLQHENVIDVRAIFYAGSKNTFEDVYVISELMETDLASILKSSQPLSDEHTQFFLYQLLRGMKYIHSAQVIHRDLKPRNLLVNANCDLKICDFGLARVNPSDKTFQTCPMTEYICTRWYRAPEVLCSWAAYTNAIDVWSIGCIFAEMLKRIPVFPGHNTQHQLQLILSFLGTPRAEELGNIPNSKCVKFIESLPPTSGKLLNLVFPDASDAALDFIRCTLLFNPAKRCLITELLERPYVADLYCPEDEPTRTPLPMHGFEFERRKIDIKALREELFIEVMHYNPELKRSYLQYQALHSCAYDVDNYRLLEPGESQYSSDEEEDDD